VKVRGKEDRPKIETREAQLGRFPRYSFRPPVHALPQTQFHFEETIYLPRQAVSNDSKYVAIIGDPPSP